MKSKFFIILFLLSAVAAQAQYTSRLGRFRVDQIRGCAPLTITITSTNLITTGECTAGKPCLMDYLGKNEINMKCRCNSIAFLSPVSYKNMYKTHNC